MSVAKFKHAALDILMGLPMDSFLLYAGTPGPTSCIDAEQEGVIYWGDIPKFNPAKLNAGYSSHI